MKKVVFFTDIKKISKALEHFNLKGFKEKDVPIKMHMGETRNKFYPKPALVKEVVKALVEIQIKPFLFDSTVAYPGLRSTKQGYEKLARIHGFTPRKVGCRVEIGDTGITKKVEEREYDVVEQIEKSSHIFGLSHVKGHVATGFGGAIKNFGMGGVTRETKRKMHHGAKPIYNKDKCTHCGVCAEVCPFNAIKNNQDNWKIKERSCFGCGVCVENCKQNALDYKDADLQYTLACAAKAAVQDKNMIFLNDINRISKSCDCDPRAGPTICPDVGFVLADDIVAVDIASLDLINNVKSDIFKNVNHVDPIKQIRYGEDIGLGSTDYQLIEI